jgi:hypothetical protein
MIFLVAIGSNVSLCSICFRNSFRFSPSTFSHSKRRNYVDFLHFVQVVACGWCASKWLFRLSDGSLMSWPMDTVQYRNFNGT